MTPKKRFSLLLVLAAALLVAGNASAIETHSVTFDNGTEGWMPGGACGTINPNDGNPDAYWNVASLFDCAPNSYILSGWFFLTNVTDPAFLGDYTAKGPVRISIDVNINDYTYYWFNSPVEEYRQLVVEFIDHDNQYTDPDTGHSWPFTSVIYPAGYFQNRDAGWKTFNIDIVDPSATEVPEGWTGFGGPEDPDTYLSQLPPGTTFADVMSGVDEIQIHNIEPGYFYSYGFIYDVDFDNITIRELPKECSGEEATIHVDNDGIIRGGNYDGMPYAGELAGTNGDDVIVGTDGNDSITGKRGNDIICGGHGDDSINGQHDNDMIFGGNGDDTLIGQRGDDFIMGGDGRDVINGGLGSDTCLEGEVVNQCGDAEVGIGRLRTGVRKPIGDRTVVESDDTKGTVEFGRD